MSDRTLVLVLGDQLSPALASLKSADKRRDRVFMCEVRSAATRVKYHKQKLVFVFSAMRHFAEELRDLGWSVDYVRLDAPENEGTLSRELTRAVKRHKPDRVTVTKPSSWQALRVLTEWSHSEDVGIEIVEDDRFLCSDKRFSAWAAGRKQLRMEFFYREMRKATRLLMKDGKPAGGKWNFDVDNRKRPTDDLDPPSFPDFEIDVITREVIETVEASFPDHFGRLADFNYAVTRRGAERAADHFFDNALEKFGDYQDAMIKGEPHLFHSVLSPYLNVGLLEPLDLCRRAERAYADQKAPLNAVEGFIRQIIGWREYIRGIYWLKMPDYAEQNFFGAGRPLPDFYWSGETDMACVASVVGQTRDYAYAHHIQRLMVTGTFALIAGVDPWEVHEWYLAVYSDAYEWVEMPNTLGMSQHADGGLLGSKPYAASGAYINRMSTYCSSCRYKVAKKVGDGACPFNALYWDFLARNRTRLDDNARLKNIYRTWDRMDEDKRDSYLDHAQSVLATLDDPNARL